MSLLVPINGQNYIIPETNEVGWGSNLDDFFVAISAGVLQKTGGSFTLSAETDFGSSYGLKSLYYKSRASNVAATGALRLANAETGIVWRNALNNADLALTVNSSNQLTFNGTPIESNSLTSAHILVGNASNIATDVAMSGNIGIDNTGATTIQAGVIVNSMVNAAAAIAYSKLNLTGSIVNADVNASAAIAYSKLNLSASIVNADVSASAAIAYSKLALTGSIVNADVNASAAIAYSKLALTGSIVNADISSSAAIAITKVAIGTANQIIGTNNGATANEFKTLTATANQVSVTHGAGTVTFATPQDIGTASAVRFGSLTLGGALDASSILSLTSTSKGFLPPVMTTTQKNAISTPTDGLIVFDSTLAQLFLRSASAWTPLSTGGGSGTVSSGTQYQLGYYVAGGTTISGLTLITGSRALASDANGLPVAATTTATELGYVNGVTSAIQTQINTKAPTASPTFTGTVVIPTPFTLGAVSVTATGTELNYVAGVTSAIQTQLNLLAPKASPTFTGTVTAPNLAITDTSNQLVIGTTRTVTITAPTPATSSRTWTIPDITGNGTFAALEGTQTFSGAKTFSSFVNITGVDGSAQFLTASNSSAAGLTLFMQATSNTTAAPARILMENGGATGGNIFLQMAPQSAGQTFAIGVDVLNSSQFSITRGNSPSSSADLIINATSGAVGIRGSNTNNDASAGFVGEAVRSSVTSAVSSTGNGQWFDITNIVLTAGDWDINGQVIFTLNGAVQTVALMAITSTSGNSTTGQIDGDNRLPGVVPASTNDSSATIAGYRVNFTGSATYYLKARCDFSAGTPKAYGRISARRVR